MSFTKSIKRQRGAGKMDNFGNMTKNVFCRYVANKEGEVTKYAKGFIEISGKLYGLTFNSEMSADSKGYEGHWCKVTEYKNR